MNNIVRSALLALLLAVVVALVFSLVDALDGYSAVAGVLTFVAVLLYGLFADRRV